MTVTREWLGKEGEVFYRFWYDKSRRRVVRRSLKTTDEGEAKLKMGGAAHKSDAGEMVGFVERVKQIFYDKEDRPSGFIYFIRCSGLIKIGFSTNPRKRFHNLKSMLPFDAKLLGYHAGSEETERKLHQLFWHLKRRGEWFEATPGLQMVIRRFLA